MATINKRGRCWQLNWSDADGQRRKSLGPVSRAEAELRRKEKELELLTGRRITPTSVSFADFAAEYLEWYAQHWPSTYSRTEGIFRLSLTPFFGLMALDQLTAQDHTRWITQRKGDKSEPSPATITKEARALAAMLNRAVKWKVITANPLADVEAPPERHSKAPDFYTREQIQALYKGSPFHADIWKLMVNTGLRRQEAQNLTKAHVTSDAIMVESTEDAPTKTRRWRSVPLNTQAREAIDALQTYEREHILPPIDPRSLTRAFQNCARRAKIPGTLHWLRHTFISHMVMAGADLATVQKIAGHSSITTTMRYAHLSQAHAQAAVQKISL